MIPVLSLLFLGGACAPQEAAPAADPADLHYRAAATYSEEQGGVALLVRRGGAVVFEQYSQGLGPDSAFPLYSAGHGFWAVAAVAAHEDGLLDLDGPVAAKLPAWKGEVAKQEVLVHQLLDMSSGLDPNPKPVRAPATSDRYAAAVASRMVDKPGTKYRFSPASWMVFGALLDEIGRPREEEAFTYLRRRVLAPLTIETREWDRDRAGNAMIPFGAYLTAREWSKLGQLFLDGGRVGETQVVSSEGLARCSRPSPCKPEYGMGFWLAGALTSVQEDEAQAAADAAPVAAEDHLRGLPKDLFFSAGLGGQRLYVIPSLDMVIVRQGLPAGFWSDVHCLRLLLGVEIPAAEPKPVKD